MEINVFCHINVGSYFIYFNLYTFQKVRRSQGIKNEIETNPDFEHKRVAGMD